MAEKLTSSRSRSLCLQDATTIFCSVRVVTIGYEGRTIDELVKALTDANVSTVVDVRQNAISRKAGFSKRQLEGCLSEAGIGYVHERVLGNPKENREGYRNGSEEARRRFIRHLESAGEAITRLLALAESSPIALLCYERSHSECHRESVVTALQCRRPELTLLTV